MDYTGLLNEHNKYIEVLDKLESKTEYIEIVLIDGKDTNELVDYLKDDILKIDYVSSWWGTEISDKNKLVRIKSSIKLFNKLRMYETFCKYYESVKGDYSEVTDFGYDDIAFYDKSNNILLCTTTHEGAIMFDESK